MIGRKRGRWEEVASRAVQVGAHEIAVLRADREGEAPGATVNAFPQVWRSGPWLWFLRCRSLCSWKEVCSLKWMLGAVSKESFPVRGWFRVLVPCTSCVAVGSWWGAGGVGREGWDCVWIDRTSRRRIRNSEGEHACCDGTENSMEISGQEGDLWGN